MLVAGSESQFIEFVGEAGLLQIINVHPDVQVDFVENSEELATRMLQADAAIVWPSFRFSPDVLTNRTRLRWVQFISAGVDGIWETDLAVLKNPLSILL